MFKTTLACRSFLLFTLQDFFWVCMVSMYVCMLMFQKPSPCGGFSKALSLWRVSDCEACMYVCMLSMYVCMLGHLEVPPLTNLKKLNYRSNTERFS